MLSQRSLPPAGNESAAATDRHDQLAVLLTVLDLHPVQLSRTELTRELARDPHSFGNRDRIERAVSDLTRVGLLHHPGDAANPDALIVPTRAALCASELLTDEADSDV